MLVYAVGAGKVADAWRRHHLDCRTTRAPASDNRVNEDGTEWKSANLRESAMSLRNEIDTRMHGAIRIAHVAHFSWRFPR